MSKSCKELRQTGKCSVSPYQPYPETGLEMFRQSIMNAIARKNAMDKTKNVAFGRTLSRSKDQKLDADAKREDDIRGVLKNIAYSNMVLKDYTAKSLIDAVSSNIRSGTHSALELGRTVTGSASKDGTMSGSQTRGGKKRSTKKSRRTRKKR
jgi:hypothetical protein